MRLRLPEFLDNRHMKVTRLSALCTGCLCPPGKISGTHFCLRLSQPQGPSTAGRIKSMENPYDPIGNRTGDLPACSTEPQPTVPPRTPILTGEHKFCVFRKQMPATYMSGGPQVAYHWYIHIIKTSCFRKQLCFCPHMQT
jgi:hypothetical protein